MVEQTPAAGSAAPTRETLAEALTLSGEVLSDLELADIPLSQTALKAARVARLVGNPLLERFFQFEAIGYPRDGPLDTETWQLALAAGRKMVYEDPKTKQKSDRVYVEGVDELEARRRAAENILGRAATWYEQDTQTTVIQTTTRQLATSRVAIHRYVSNVHHALKFSRIADDVFSRTSSRVAKLLAAKIPTATEHLASVYENLRSENPEDWANAVHSCRRLLKDLADAMFPAREPIQRVINGETKTIQLGAEQYLNRLVTFVEERSASERFQDLVGSNLRFVVDRLESIHSAMNKGTHARVSKEEADRYVIYTYMLVGDILSLLPPDPPQVMTPHDS